MFELHPELTRRTNPPPLVFVTLILKGYQTIVCGFFLWHLFHAVFFAFHFLLLFLMICSDLWLFPVFVVCVIPVVRGLLPVLPVFPVFPEYLATCLGFSTWFLCFWAIFGLFASDFLRQACVTGLLSGFDPFSDLSLQPLHPFTRHYPVVTPDATSSKFPRPGCRHQVRRSFII